MDGRAATRPAWPRSLAAGRGRNHPRRLGALVRCAWQPPSSWCGGTALLPITTYHAAPGGHGFQGPKDPVSMGRKSATGIARHRPGERETIGSVATRALTGDSVEMEFLTDDPVAQAVTCQRATFDARAPHCGRCGCAAAGVSEPDLMVRLADLRLRERYQDWDRGPVTGEPGPHPGLRGHRSACRMKVATATGFAMNAVCEPSMVSVVAPIRRAMNRSASGEIALSCSETRNHDGLLFQPAAVAFSLSAAAASGRWVANMTSAMSTGTSAQNVPRNCASWTYRSGPPAAPGAS